MPLEELIYYRLELSEEHILASFADAVKGFLIPDRIEEEPIYRVNFALMLYGVAARLNARVFEFEDGSFYEPWTADHLGKFLDYHVFGGWGRDSAISWEFGGVKGVFNMERVFTGHIKKFDGSNGELDSVDGVDEQGEPTYRKGLVFVRDTLDDSSKFVEKFREFIPRFEGALGVVCNSHHVPYRRIDFSRADKQ